MLLAAPAMNIMARSNQMLVVGDDGVIEPMTAVSGTMPGPAMTRGPTRV